MRLTKHRQEILDTLAACHGALSARELHDKLPHINLVTIYRNLESFAEANMIKKLHLDSNEAVFEYQSEPHHHAVCTNCDNVVHFTVDETKLAKALHIKGFAIDDVEIVVRGTCKHKHT